MSEGHNPKNGGHANSKHDSPLTLPDHHSESVEQTQSIPNITNAFPAQYQDSRSISYRTPNWFDLYNQGVLVQLVLPAVAAAASTATAAALANANRSKSHLEMNQACTSQVSAKKKSRKRKRRRRKRKHSANKIAKIEPPQVVETGT